MKQLAKPLRSILQSKIEVTEKDTWLLGFLLRRNKKDICILSSTPIEGEREIWSDEIWCQNAYLFKYLGSIIQKNGEINKDITNRIKTR